jgi:hypothetical protein
MILSIILLKTLLSTDAVKPMTFGNVPVVGRVKLEKSLFSVSAPPESFSGSKRDINHLKMHPMISPCLVRPAFANLSVLIVLFRPTFT